MSRTTFPLEEAKCTLGAGKKDTIYPVSDKFALTDELKIRTHRPYIQLKIDKQVAHAIGQGSTLNSSIGERC